ncbi:hypothetical protein FB45DRAFT_447617 [Roridomyces roridus]|uniref:Uncharacterized protein n=1 Tax=Roridomyces roridus TaxID=1738132 RepID=A0AAD7C1R2_9AGAR|nr:hypothetical protein FB45DRAFT_447617 [Roridomyces roridus]
MATVSTAAGDASLPILSQLSIPPLLPSISSTTDTAPISTPDPSLSSSPPSSDSLALSTTSSTSLIDVFPSSSLTSSSAPLSTSTTPSTSPSSDPATTTSTFFVSQSAEPSQSAHASAVGGSSNSSFFHNKGAVAAVFTLTGICTVVLTLWLLTCALRRRRRRQLDREMDVAGAFIPDAARRAIEADDYEKATGGGPAYGQQHSTSSSHPLRHPSGLAPPPNTVYAQWSSGYDRQQQYASGGAYITLPAPVSLKGERPGQCATDRDSPAAPVPLTGTFVSLRPGERSQVFDTSPPTVPSKDSDYLSKYSLSPPVSSDGHGSAEEDNEGKPHHPLHVINE